MRTGQRDPGRVNTRRVAQALKDAQERERVLDQAVTQQRAHVLEFVHDHQDDLLEAVGAQRADAEAPFREALETLEAARMAFHGAASLARWVKAPERRHKAVQPRVHGSRLTLPNGDAPAWTPSWPGSGRRSIRRRSPAHPSGTRRR